MDELLRTKEAKQTAITCAFELFEMLSKNEKISNDQLKELWICIQNGVQLDHCFYENDTKDTLNRLRAYLPHASLSAGDLQGFEEKIQTLLGYLEEEKFRYSIYRNGYGLQVMSDDTVLKAGQLYLKKAEDGTITYSVIAPDGKTYVDQKTSIQSPDELDIDTLDSRIKNKIIAYAVKKKQAYGASRPTIKYSISLQRLLVNEGALILYAVALVVLVLFAGIPWPVFLPPLWISTISAFGIISLLSLPASIMETTSFPMPTLPEEVKDALSQRLENQSELFLSRQSIKVEALLFDSGDTTTNTPKVPVVEAQASPYSSRHDAFLPVATVDEHRKLKRAFAIPIRGCQAKVITVPISRTEKQMVEAYKQIVIVRKDADYEICFCNIQNKYEQIKITDVPILTFLNDYTHDQWIKEIDHQNQINTLLESLNSCIYIRQQPTEVRIGPEKQSEDDESSSPSLH